MSRADPAVSVRGRIDGLDGVRAVANLTVVLVHLDLINQSGWIAMQAFFLLSGFLITRVLLDLKHHHGRGRFFGEFYTFRVLRILPAYFSYLLLLALCAWLFAPAMFESVRSQLPWLFLFIYNYSWIWETPVKTPWLVHLWSLSVEEQFYLLWPLLVWFVPTRRIPWLMLGLVLGGPLFRLVTYWVLAPYAERAGSHGAAAVYIAMPTYLDSFALGGALCFDIVRKRLSAIPSVVYFAMIVLAIGAGLLWNAWVSGLASLNWATLGYPILMPARGQFLWGYSVTGLLLTILLAKVVEGRFGHRLFCRSPIEKIGQVTYSLYLIHHGPVLLFALLTPMLATALGMAPEHARLLWLPVYFLVLYSVAFLSFSWIEQPAMRLRRRWFPQAGRTGS
jgi:peptidoglycan/LPS O-acetylase OafA/YrhL